MAPDDSQSMPTSHPGSTGSPASATEGRGGVFLGLRLALWLAVAPVIIVACAWMAQWGEPREVQ